MLRPSLLVTALLLAPALSARAASCGGGPAAAPATHALFGSLSALNIGMTYAPTRLNGESSLFAAMRIGLAHCRLAEYTFALTAGTFGGIHRTPYAATDALDEPNPPLFVYQLGATVERRWRRGEVLRPLVSLEGGTVHAAYSYVRRTGTRSESVLAGGSAAGYLQPAVGVDVALFNWVTVDARAGLRVSGALRTPGLGARPVPGAFVSTGVSFGKF